MQILECDESQDRYKLEKNYEELKKEWEELGSRNSGFEELWSVCIGSFAMSALMSLVLAIINMDFGYFYFFLINCLFTVISYIFATSKFAKQQSVMSSANEWPQYHWNIIWLI